MMTGSRACSLPSGAGGTIPGRCRPYPGGSIHAVAEAEVAAGKGHDVSCFPGPPPNSTSMRLIMRRSTRPYPSSLAVSIASRTNRSFNPRAKKYFALPILDSAPCIILRTTGVRSGCRSARSITAACAAAGVNCGPGSGVPCGSACAKPGSNITLHTLLYAFLQQRYRRRAESPIGRNAPLIGP